MPGPVRNCESFLKIFTGKNCKNGILPGRDYSVYSVAGGRLARHGKPLSILNLHNMKVYYFTFLVLAALTSCNNQKADLKANEDQIRHNHADWEKLAATGDIEKILFYWTDDAVIMAPGQPLIQGKDAIRAMLQNTKNIPGFKMEWDSLKKINMSKSGDLAYIITHNKTTVNDSLGNPVTQDNKALTIWRKEPDNSWKEAVVIFTPDPPHK
jgi:ketosteroid isomerase-like protein